MEPTFDRFRDSASHLSKKHFVCFVMSGDVSFTDAKFFGSRSCRSRMRALIVIFVLQTIIFTTGEQQFKLLFHLSSFGLKFQSGNASDLISTQSNISSMNRCAMMCSSDERCQTLDYDSSSKVCRLFLSWANQSMFIASTSSTVRVAFVKQTPDLYSLYQQPCIVQNDINRYLSCANNSLWTCKSGLFYDGSICTNQYPVEMTTAGYSHDCLNNQTQYWNGTQCVPSKNNAVSRV